MSLATQATSRSAPQEPRWRPLLRALTPRRWRKLYWQSHERRQRARMRRGTHYESAVCAAIRSIVRPGWTCLDIGANRGLVTIPLAERIGPAGRVHAFEPHPDNLRELRANLRDFSLTDRVTLHALAVNDGSLDRVRLFAGRRDSSSEWNIIGHDADGHPTRHVLDVPARSLDSLFHPDHPIHLVKIDVEGAESLVLRGMRSILTHQRPSLIIECHSRDNFQTCLTLRELDYEVSDLTGRTLTPADQPVSHLIARPRAMIVRAARAA